MLRWASSLGAVVLAGLCAGAIGACSAAGEDGSTGTGSGAGGPGSGPGAGGSGEGGAFGSSSATGEFEECATAEDTAIADKLPADIILVVDTSGSMSEETAWVAAGLNDFANIITGAGIDLRVVLIADSNTCIPAPLGSGQCGGADSNEPTYRHVNQVVASTDSLELILSTYPQWSDMLRPQATKTFLVVTDDESDLDANSFHQQLITMDTNFNGYKFDSIVANSNAFACLSFGTCPANNACCYQDGPFCASYGEAEGATYKQLSQASGGVIGDLCLQEFGPIFDDMAAGVVASSQIACDYALPPPPEGEVLDPTKVNVTYYPAGSTDGQPIYNVPGGAEDCGAEGGWYYDDAVNPTRILTCPATCTVLEADTTGEVKVVFGCATVTVPE